MILRRVVLSSAVVLVALLATFGATASAQTPAMSPTVMPSAAQAPQVFPVISLALRFVARRALLRWLPSYVVKRQLTRWVGSRGSWCPPRLDQRYFCAGRPNSIRGVGMVWPPREYSGMTVRSEPTFADGPALAVARYGTLGLSCYTLGQGDVGMGGYTRLWYRTWTGWYVWDGWLYTGTNAVLPGVPRC